MAYNITLTNGTNLVTVADGTIVTDYTSLTLVGKNFAGYGSFLNENFVKLIENFANTTEPPNALQGQIWWDTTNKVLKVRNGAVWKTVSSSTSSSTPPVNATVGDLWWDVTNGQLNVWSGSQWVVIGPSYTALQRKTGAIADSVTELGGSGVSHIVVKFFVNDVLVAILSKDPSFTSTGLTGFTTINPGFNLSTIGNLGYWGDANNALNLGGVAAANYMRTNAVNTTTFPINVQTDTGLTVGASTDFTIGVTSTDVNLLSNISGKHLNLYTNVGGISQKMLTVSGTTGQGILVAGDPTVNLGIATKQYVDNQLGGPSSPLLRRDGGNTIAGTIYPDANATRDLGTLSSKFNTIYAVTFNGNASTANYADLAERFEADVVYEPGTVVELGGDAEVTSVIDDLSDNVFGVISTNAAYLMNAGAGSDLTHPPIAMQGRVPVKVVGVVNKGDRLVSAGNGMARSALKSEITPFNVIGRALVDKLTAGEGTVEAIVKLNS